MCCYINCIETLTNIYSCFIYYIGIDLLFNICIELSTVTLYTHVCLLTMFQGIILVYQSRYSDTKEKRYHIINQSYYLYEKDFKFY